MLLPACDSRSTAPAMSLEVRTRPWRVMNLPRNPRFGKARVPRVGGLDKGSRRPGAAGAVGGGVRMVSLRGDTIGYAAVGQLSCTSTKL